MTGVPATKVKVHRPWREIAAEIASLKDLARVAELAHELNCALEEQGFDAEETETARNEVSTYSCSAGLESCHSE